MAFPFTTMRRPASQVPGVVNETTAEALDRDVRLAQVDADDALGVFSRAIGRIETAAEDQQYVREQAAQQVAELLAVEQAAALAEARNTEKAARLREVLGL